jgi:hypothetical protein
VLGLENRFTGLEIDLEDTGEVERDLTRDQEDRRAVGLDPDPIGRANARESRLYG